MFVDLNYSKVHSYMLKEKFPDYSESILFYLNTSLWVLQFENVGLGF